jgi:hypothetical protein
LLQRHGFDVTITLEFKRQGVILRAENRTFGAEQAAKREQARNLYGKQPDLNTSLGAYALIGGIAQSLSQLMIAT